MKDPKTRLLDNLKAARHARGLTHADVASAIRISRPQYTAIEQGRSEMGFRHLHNIAVTLGVRITVGNEDDPSIEQYIQDAGTRSS